MPEAVHGFKEWNDKFTRHPIGLVLKAGYFLCDNWRAVPKPNYVPEIMRLYSSATAPLRTSLNLRTSWVVMGAITHYINTKSTNQIHIPLSSDFRRHNAGFVDLLFEVANQSHTKEFFDCEFKNTKNSHRFDELLKNLDAMRGLLREIGEIYDPATGRVIPVKYESIFDE